MEKTEVAYAAGLLDGEGSITTKWPKRWQLSLEVKMVSKPCVERFAKIVNGRCVTGHIKRKDRLPQWRCRLYDNQAIEALIMMIPYLSEKQEQAKLAIEFKQSKCPATRTRLNDQIINSKKRFY